MIRYEVTTLGDEVFESESGPTLGYDNIRTFVVEFEDEDEAADYFATHVETIRSMIPSKS